jgi:hypothetical protein
MAGPSAVLFNTETNTYEAVPAEQVGAAISSGKYTATGANTETEAEGGTVTRPVAQLGAAEVQGEGEAGAANAQRNAAARREVQKELVSDKFLSFSEGVVDALSVGLIHGTREADELRREADSGSALLGQLVGTALGLKLPGPIKGLVEGGEALGAGAARALLGEAETGFRGVVTRGLQEAGANAALMAASAFGHQITDSVIADKPFAAEAVLSEAGTGAMLGFGFGFAGSAFGQLAKASRGAVEASGIAAKESKAALDAVGDLTRQWDSVVDQHAQRVGVLRVLADEGHIPGDMHYERASNLHAAESARDALRELDETRAFGGDPKEFQRWRDAVERYQAAVAKLDESMTPSALERAHANPVKVGESPNSAGPQIHPLDVDKAMEDQSFRSPMSEELDRAMTPEARAKYAEIYGRPFEEGPKVGGNAGAAVGEENLGGRATPTSELGTNPGVKRRASSPPSQESGGALVPRGEAGVAERPVDVQRFKKPLAKYREPPGIIDAEGQTIGPRQVMEAGERPAGQAETAKDFTDATKKELLGLPPGEGEAATTPIDKSQGKKAVRDYLNNWFREFDAKPRVSLGDQLKVRLTEALDNIAKASGGRLDSAGSLELLKSLGLREAGTPLGQRLDQVWSLGQAGKFAADEARGVKTPLRKGLLGQIQRYATHKGARVAAGALLGSSVGGPMGAILGMALTSAGFAGKAASTAGRLMQQIAVVGDALLKGRRATLTVKAVAGNRPYQYSDAGPIKDPVQRIMEVQRLAANPAAIKARVQHQLGDLALTSPDMAQHILETTINHIKAIAASAPAIMLSPLGRPIQPSGTALNKFFDFENAMHDLPGTLDAIGKGTATSGQLRALQVGFPAVHAELVRHIVGKVEGLQALQEAKLRTMERALGIPLTRATADPTVTSRFQGNWHAPQPAPQPAQAFKITADKPTAAQSMSSGDRAPGNERIAR